LEETGRGMVLAPEELRPKSPSVMRADIPPETATGHPSNSLEI